MENQDLPWYTLIFIGIVVFQLVFIIYQYLIYKRVEYVYYLLYVILVSVYHIFLDSTILNPFKFTITEESNLVIDRGIALLCYYFYFKFGEYYCNMESLYTDATKILRYVQKAILVIAILDIITAIIAQKYYIFEPFMYGFIITLTIYSFLLVMFLVKQKDILVNILVVGTLALLIFIVFSTLYMKVTPGFKRQDTIQFSYIGVVLEFLFLNFGLSLKSKYSQEKALNVTLVSSQELLDERDRITADLHDEIGGGISTIRILSDIHKNVNDLETHKKFAYKIAEISEDLSQKMKTIIWALKPENDEIHSFIAFVEDYSRSILENTPIKLHFHAEDIQKEIILSNIVRKNLFLCVKEALNNCLKHAQAQEIKIEILLSNKNILDLSVTDDGIGFSNTNNGGNGLRIMEKRMNEIDGKFKFESESNATKLTFSVKI
jgi:signal transduction histidine kinase